MPSALSRVSWPQTMASAKPWLRIGGGAVIAVVLWLLWNAETPWVRWLGFIGVAIVVDFGVVAFLEAPMEWLRYWTFRAVFGLLSASRAIIRALLIMLAALLSAIYALSPLDFIPDVLIGLGWIDDLLVAFGLIFYAAKWRYAIPAPSASAKETARHPVGRVVSAAAIAVGLAGLLRLITG